MQADTFHRNLRGGGGGGVVLELEVEVFMLWEPCFKDSSIWGIQETSN